MLLEGLGYLILAETYYQMNLLDSAVYPASLGFYLLDQKQAPELRQIQNLITVLRNRLESQHFFLILAQKKAEIKARIGLEGFEYVEQELKSIQ